MMYGTDEIDRSYNTGRLAQASQPSSALGQTETELSSLLSAINTIAYELKGLTANIFSRVSPLPEENCADKQCFSGGYIGQTEQARSTLRETARLLTELSKLI
jgi:hypothetical protein